MDYKDVDLVLGGTSRETIASRKLFVGGVSQETTGETLKEYFSKYGQVREYEIIKDRNTGSGRGFGFISFTDPFVVDGVLQDEHIILGKMDLWVEVKMAKPKIDRLKEPDYLQQQQSNRLSKTNCTKIFVGGLPPTLTKEDLRRFFQRFGTIIDVVVIHNKETNKPRGFGFIVFDSEEAVNNVLKKSFYKLKNKEVEVKRAKPKDMIGWPISIYDCNNTGLGFGNGSFGFYSPSAPSGGVNLGYSYGLNSYNGLEAPFMAGAPFMGYNGVGYETSFASTSYNQSPIGYGSTVSYPAQTNSEAYGYGYGYGWSSGFMDMNNGAYRSRGVMDMNASTSVVNTNSSDNDNDDGNEVEVLASTRLLQIGDGSNSEDNGAEHQNKGRSCDSS
ncbi:heterogeneous nuclear ribonucleoprotein 1-like [Cornus florida]|uniref:heterogeneous nuclear ribonucleoprotein 1-like n=1 Tax=Cornus florida TaxID=4283 RepID=UPI002896C5E8|nr:heterogeneous nuclear ribonucleoprotein 1-like [Cornus florida]